MPSLIDVSKARKYLKNPRTYAVTGHRPPRLGGYDKSVTDRLYRLALYACEERAPGLIITGMAQGWDVAIAKAAIELEIPFIAAVPCNNFSSKWPKVAQAEHQELLEKAYAAVLVTDRPYNPYLMIKRDHWMVDNCNAGVLGLYDGHPEGGTYKTYLHANEKAKPFFNYFSYWQN